MDHSSTPTGTPTIRHDGWTEARKAQFLEHLAGHGNVRATCARVGMSHEAAYKLRRRDALVARAWDAALNLAREASAQGLACRAIDGIEEEIWYRGEVVGTRRRYDTRLLLAHIARLDALAASDNVREDAARFDQLVALAAGARPPDGLPCDKDGVPLAREASIDLMIEIATEVAEEEAESGAGEDGQLGAVERYRAGADAAACWDAWLSEACVTVDLLADQPCSGFVGTPSTPSTSPLAAAPADGQLPA
jgi:hypothetical protein